MKTSATGITKAISGFLLITAVLSAPNAFSQVQVDPSTAPTSPSAPAEQSDAMKREAWRRAMTKTSLPPGCFKAVYPDTEWQPVQCGKPPSIRYQPRPTADSFTVGAGNDYAAQVSSGSISSSEGSFNKITGVTSETQYNYAGSNTYTEGPANGFSLQLNTNLFTTEKCTGAPNSACKGWVQFVYGNPGAGGEGKVLIEYWLIQYGATGTAACPTGWTTDNDGDCFQNSSTTSVPATTIAALSELSLTGKAVSGGSDTATLSVDGTLYAESIADSAIYLADTWDNSEFNIFGDGNLSQARFNAGSTIAVVTTAQNGKASHPTTVVQSLTAETNNLNLIPASGSNCVAGLPSPQIVFTESNVSGAQPICPPATLVSIISQF